MAAAKRERQRKTECFGSNGPQCPQPRLNVAFSFESVGWAESAAPANCCVVTARCPATPGGVFFFIDKNKPLYSLGSSETFDRKLTAGYYNKAATITTANLLLVACKFSSVCLGIVASSAAFLTPMLF
ncbi:MAG: hypothetical protein ACK5L3_14905 [Oscillospiraceae bacterium]